jgi:hypothetical protein
MEVHAQGIPPQLIFMEVYIDWNKKTNNKQH